MIFLFNLSQESTKVKKTTKEEKQEVLFSGMFTLNSTYSVFLHKK